MQECGKMKNSPGLIKKNKINSHLAIRGDLDLPPALQIESHLLSLSAEEFLSQQLCICTLERLIRTVTEKQFHIPYKT